MTNQSLHRHPTRRQLLLLAASSSLAWPLNSLIATEASDRKIRVTDYPFRLGVASGDPTSDGVVIWTRLAPDPLHGGGMTEEAVPVRWQVATDDGMRNVVRKGVTSATAAWGHSVHVEVHGLQPDRTYWYQFDAAGEQSPVGRTRTAPAADVMLDRLRFAFVSCQHYETGYYNSHRQIAQDDLHAVIHLGDYIYEGGINKTTPRQHNSAEVTTLDEYRNRHALYRSDDDLQAAHAAHPWLVTWDDHEFDNNYANDVSEESGVDVESFLRRRAVAYQAYYEHMPLRRSSLPNGPLMHLYRNVDYGRLAQFSMLDTRQYRTDQPCGDGNRPPCDGVNAPDATLLGDRQEQWLCDQLKSSTARWNVLAQQVMMARVDRAPGDAVKWSMDQWGGYDVGRKRLLQYIADHKISNPVVLTGDIHTNWVNDLLVDFDDAGSPIVATEFVGTSVSSGGNGKADNPYGDAMRSENPFVKFFNSQRGYVRCELTPDQWQSEYRITPRVTDRNNECLTRATFVVENGQSGAIQVS